MIEIRDSYWIQTHRFMAGEYPGSSDESTALAKLEWLLSININFFINLTEPDEYGLKPYEILFDKVQADITETVMYTNFPIPDMETPSVSQMVKILDTIDNALTEDRNIYMHCYGGIGRTGTVVGCYYVRHGLEPQQALDRIAELRKNTPDGWRSSPETSEQRRMVLNWSE
jgi:protein tyrosine/serine phosphatase